ncbi:MAG TPA: TonB-dependent receptor [Steroidobacteraceae bacterium]|nr:TonB-dependent receptor [Steroidobacteraceae bacterium]
MSNSSITNSVRFALATAATASLSQLSMQTAMAQEQDQDATESMEEVIVTGSRVRRLDTESASPIVTIDKASIEKSGVTTAGDLLQRLPTVSGAATNPAVNNGGGFGEANVELRGLDAKRTLVLLNGRRLGLVGASDATDINLIPVNLIERVDVLKEGAGAIYGSDAIAGVVNFITRKDVEGAELTAGYGETAENDGKTQNVNLLWGTSGDNFRFSINGNYNKTEKVSAGDRAFSEFAMYFYSGSVFPGGSSRVPTGRFYVPAGSGLPPNVANCASVTRVAGSDGTDLATDYRCYNGQTDAYNYQPFNLIMTPQERGSIFANYEYDINEAVQLYAEVLYSRTSSGFQIAPLPFDALADDVVISADSYYNPFGYDFGGATTGNPNLTVRLEALGNRRSKTSSDSKVAKIGARGGLFGSEWNYDFLVGYSRLDQAASVSGYLYQPGLAGAFGPSFDAGGGVIQCGTPTNPIPLGQCTPVNVFNLADPAQVSALGTISSGYDTDRIYTSKMASFAVDGKMFSMPAGDALASIQADYTELRGDFNVDFLITATPPLYLNCFLAQETCTGPNSGGYDVSELSAEVFLPLVKDVTGVQALNLTLGTRYSEYSIFDSTTNSTVKLEYRPVEDILLSGTFAEVFRAPTILDLYASPANNSSTFTDPCVGLTTARITANPNLALACVGVPTDGSFEQPNGQVTGLLMANEDLDPETGDVMTFGITWQPSFLNNNFSIRVDYWEYQIDDVITQLDTNFSINQCVATGDPAFCNLVTRFTDPQNAGIVYLFRQPTVNLGTLETDGVDIGASYHLRDTPAGNWAFQIDWTHINKYNNLPAENAAIVEVAGTYDRQYGNYAENRATATIGWSMNKFDAQIGARFIDDIVLLLPSGGTLPPEDNPPLPIDSFVYLDLYFGYTFNDNIKVSLSATNLSDEQPPMLFQNNVTNANTDVNTYDTLGRRYAISATYKF